MGPARSMWPAMWVWPELTQEDLPRPRANTTPQGARRASTTELQHLLHAVTQRLHPTTTTMLRQLCARRVATARGSRAQQRPSGAARLPLAPVRVAPQESEPSTSSSLVGGHLVFGGPPHPPGGECVAHRRLIVRRCHTMAPWGWGITHPAPVAALDPHKECDYSQPVHKSSTRSTG